MTSATLGLIINFKDGFRRFKKELNIDRIKEVTAKIPELLVNLVASGATAMSVGHLITSITDAVTTRLLQLAEKRLGPAPVAYAWVAAGSQAREEQIAKTDQDNILILADDYIYLVLRRGLLV